MLDTNPFKQFQVWFEQAKTVPNLTYPNAMTVATYDESGYPDSRILLLKECDDRGFVFFTNKHSVKSRQLRHHPKASMVFFWEKLGFQVRIQGDIEDTTAAESDTYFSSRPRLSQIGAWASLQSEALDSRDTLEKRVAAYEQQYHEKPVDRPPHWGGYRLVPVKIEFWIERPFRLHDRFIYTKTETGDWTVTRVYP